ncbi:hypothetical protein [Nannocystis bainbridge]|uniref:Uncharacterized protein n=1 Tax=Nannocystis bainbridge TaxID=2995303 RepID=A0ABT5EB10_9BACT|nr:hypothetical protein [Nannocystis bainbridge]MDC0722529.1 hypothetical protein [Nannocystis bainbridge]
MHSARACAESPSHGGVTLSDSGIASIAALWASITPDRGSTIAALAGSLAAIGAFAAHPPTSSIAADENPRKQPCRRLTAAIRAPR